ncbi:hypothetical protein GCM10011320_59470 [Neoroseomonas lacus]|uniref:Uncharacterized protein n=1 Tax=Neoroseomonas lacus TaxID=287609 RepID=A0A917NZL4_9PROT|nr:hypothetical protein GCM10011320_59470 [Neoroseomonas lacus]
MADCRHPRVTPPPETGCSPTDQAHRAGSDDARSDAEDLLRALTRALARQAARDAWAKAVGRHPISETSS